MRWVVGTALACALAACAPPEERAAAYVAKAQALLEAGDLVDAQLEAQNAVQIQPKNAEAHYLLARVAEQKGEMRAAIGSLLVAVDADPRHVPSQVRLGTLLFLAGAYEEAERRAGMAAELAPQDKALRLLQARLHFYRKDYVAGLAALDGVLAEEPDHLDALLLKVMVTARDEPAAALALVDDALTRVEPQRSRALRQARLSLVSATQPGAVEAELRALTRDFPQDAGFARQLADLYVRSARIEDAEQVLRDLVARQPEDAQLRLGLVRFLAAQRGTGVAEAALLAFVGQDPDQHELRLALARQYDASGRTADAGREYAEIARRDPTSRQGLAARNRMAQLALREGRREEGLGLIAAILDDVADEPEALLLRAGVRHDAGDHEGAIADLRAVLRREPESQAALALFARTYVKSNEIPLAVDAYRRLLRVNPAHGDALSLAQLLVTRDDPAGAIAVLESHLAAVPDSVAGLAALVELQIRTGALPAAEASARRLEGMPGNEGAGAFELGRVLLAQGKPAKAAESFRAAMAARPGDFLPVEGLAQSLMADKQDPAAVREVRRYLQAHPDAQAARRVLATLLARQGDRDGARRLLDEVIAAQPDSPQAYVAQAALETQAAARVAVYRRGLASLPGNAELGGRLAAELQSSGQFDEAIAVNEQVVAANPALAIAVNDLASLLLDYRSDRASHERALALARGFADSTNPLAVDTLGWAYYRTGDIAQAVSTLERAAALGGELPVLRYHLGMAYAAAGDDAKARAQLEQAIAAGVEFPGLSDARRQLASLR